MECGKNEAEVKGCMYFTVSKLFRIFNKIAEEAFEGMELCPTHGFLMIILQDSKNGMSVNEISEKLTIAPSTVTRFVDKLVEKKYVERIKIGKQSFTKMTVTGKRAMPEIYNAWGKIFTSIEKLVDNQEYLTEVNKKLREFTEYVDENSKKETM